MSIVKKYVENNGTFDLFHKDIEREFLPVFEDLFRESEEYVDFEVDSEKHQLWIVGSGDDYRETKRHTIWTFGLFENTSQAKPLEDFEAIEKGYDPTIFYCGTNPNRDIINPKFDFGGMEADVNTDGEYTVRLDFNNVKVNLLTLFKSGQISSNSIKKTKASRILEEYNTKRIKNER